MSTNNCPKTFHTPENLNLAFCQQYISSHHIVPSWQIKPISTQDPPLQCKQRKIPFTQRKGTPYTKSIFLIFRQVSIFSSSFQCQTHIEFRSFRRFFFPLHLFNFVAKQRDDTTTWKKVNNKKKTAEKIE